MIGGVHLFSGKNRGGGWTRLPKFKFSANFPIGLLTILQKTDKNKKIKNA